MFPYGEIFEQHIVLGAETETLADLHSLKCHPLQEQFTLNQVKFIKSLTWSIPSLILCPPTMASPDVGEKRPVDIAVMVMMLLVLVIMLLIETVKKRRDL